MLLSIFGRANDSSFSLRLSCFLTEHFDFKLTTLPSFLIPVDSA
jgi:hypothetical protein